ncbi:hypothetical protein [Streptomyces yaizuensis]|uniref:Uncharacterized protein n=1 Tax=Streptomyces yaizuensis TaxID=2989713 RepID=A0ABQ5NXJ0_9ACTN|nr:hypothetical protein [Streptomyces sp. YSPA8]GLF95081.1 hypothetical protein SYYSPA8_12310 [Streptomyces sp. YSPA8]
MAYHLRFFFEYGVDHTPLWPGTSGDPGLASAYGYPCEPERLPITPAVRTELSRLCDLYQSSLDWDDPMGPSPWTREQWTSFEQSSDTLLDTLRRDLGNGWTVEDLRT